MTRHTINLEVVEAFCLCPRKAFLLMTEATASPGPHEYEVVIREQAEANRQAHRASLAEEREVVPFGGQAELADGREIVADANLSAGGLHARCDFLMKVAEPSRFGRFSYEPVKIVGACRVARPDALGLVYQGLVLGEVQGRQPSSGTLVLVGDRPSKVSLADKYKGVRRITVRNVFREKFVSREAAECDCDRFGNGRRFPSSHSSRFAIDPT